MEVTLTTLIAGRPRTVHLDSPEFVIGRGPDCDLQLECPLVSRHHCVLTTQDHAVYARDLTSRNGTGVNNQRLIGERPLHDGDTLWVAATPIEVRIRRKRSSPLRAGQWSGTLWRALRFFPNIHPGRRDPAKTAL